MTIFWFVVGILIFAIGIAFSIFWHELGHFVTARWFGIKVPEFMIGFGKTLVSFRRGETEYGFKLIPMGGYVRMIGMIPPAKGETLGSSRRTGPFQGFIDDVRAQSAMDVRPEDADRQFYLRAPWKRIIVMAAGPIMNLILAVVLFAVLLMGIGLNSVGTAVSAVSECVIPAATAQAEQRTECLPSDPATPAAAAGFLPGDRIIGLGGQTFDEGDGQDLRAAIQATTGPVVVTVDRGGQTVDLPVTPVPNPVRSAANPDEVITAGFLGVELQQGYYRQGLGAVFVHIGDIIGRTGQAIAELPSRLPALFGAVFLGEERDQEGPIGVVGVSRIGGEILAQDIPFAAEASLIINLLAAVNISLFLFNLLPIPPLDGGQIFPAIWESIRRRIATVRGRPDPGPVDVAKLMPVAYVFAMFFIVWSGLLFIADIINPIRFFQ